MKNFRGTMNNYYFVHRQDSVFFRPCEIITKNPSDIHTEDIISVSGDYEFCKPGDIWTTSPIVKVHDDIVETINSMYRLENPHEDYVKMLEADKAGIPVIGNWYFAMGASDIILCGEDQRGRSIMGEVVGQDESGNYLLIAVTKTAFIKIFLCWPDAADSATYQEACDKALSEINAVENAFGHEVRLRFSEKYRKIYDEHTQN